MWSTVVAIPPQKRQIRRSRARMRSVRRCQAQPESRGLLQLLQRLEEVGMPQPTQARSITATR
jgi:hypothetical protein